MLKKRVHITLLLGQIFFIVSLYCQSAGQLLLKYITGSSPHSSESIYFQTSKGIYETGEDLWFKAYQLDAQTFGLSDKSKTLYLQMIDPKDSVVWREKYPIENSIVSGHIYIDEKLSEGDYFLEGYTKHSFYRNDATGITPTRKIRIVKNIARSESKPIINTRKGRISHPFIRLAELTA